MSGMASINLNCSDLDVDAEPEFSLSDERQSAGRCQPEPSSMCTGHNSGNNPADHQDDMSRGSEANLSAPGQNEQTMKRPDGSSTSDDSRSQKMEFNHQRLSLRDETDHQCKSQCEIFLPPELKQQHFDIIIIHAEENKREAENLKKIIEELYDESEGGKRTPITVGLIEEVALHVRSNVDWLDTAMSCCTYIFVIFTQHLTNDCVLSEMTKASLWATFSEEKKNMFCPVYLEKGAQKELNLSVYIKERIGINMWKNPSCFKARIKKYIDVAPRIERCQRQDQAAKEFCEKRNDTTKHSAPAETADFSHKSHMNSIPFAPNSQPAQFSVPCRADSSPVDVKTHLTRPEHSEDSFPDDMNREHDSAADECDVEVDNTLETPNDSHNYMLVSVGVGALIGASLVYLFQK